MLSTAHKLYPSDYFQLISHFHLAHVRQFVESRVVAPMTEAFCSVHDSLQAQPDRLAEADVLPRPFGCHGDFCIFGRPVLMLLLFITVSEQEGVIAYVTDSCLILEKDDSYEEYGP